ncbi:MAG: type V CRISPR-associated protein Cas12d [Candidatus Saccharimonadales bacterium]
MVVAKYCGIDTFGKYSENQRFYINPRSRDKRLARIVYDQTALPYSDNFTQLAFKILNDITDPRQVLSRLRQTIEHLEILKTITAILVINYREETIIIEPKDDKQKQFIAMASADNSLDKFVLGKFMQTLVFAEIKGLLSLVSKQRYIARYVISTSDDSDYRLLIDKATIDTGSTNWTTKAKFYLAATVGDISKQYSDKQYVEFIKPSGSSEYNFNEKNAFKTTQSGYHYYSINSTSRYHKQFLWWLLVKPKHKHNKLGFMSPSIIAEEIITLNWTNGILTAKTEDSSTRVYLALPLYLAAENAKENEHYAASTNKIIGVDVGEKGLAYVVAKRTKISKGYNLEIVEKGFLRQAEHDILASKVKQLRARQVLGVFGESDTYVARLRKKLIDAYRSQLDSLALKHSARLSFEASISGFETGGNKIKKIYASLKKSAVPAGVEADKSVVTHYWGAATRKAENHIGSQIVAAGTSQRCSKCKRWSSRYINDNVKYEVSEVSKGLGSVMLLDGEKLMIFSDKVIPTTIDGQELKKLVYAFMRPPLDSAAATYVSDVSGNVLIKELLMNKETWIKNNANSAIYICPYEKCLHVSDADIQAALNIAIRGFIKFDHGNKKQSEESGQDYDTVLNNLKMQEELYNYPEIELNIQSRL